MQREQIPPLASEFKNIPHMIAFFQDPEDAKKDFPNYNKEQYDVFLKRCTRERQTLGVGNSGALNALYRFWCYYLRKHFNTEMYNSFREFAANDAKVDVRYGIECLFRYYSYGLEHKFRQNVFEDFQTDTLADYETGQLYGLEKFWAYLVYHGRAKNLQVKPELTLHLARFTSFDDFRQEEQIRGQHYSGRRKHHQKRNVNTINADKNEDYGNQNEELVDKDITSCSCVENEAITNVVSSNRNNIYTIKSSLNNINRKGHFGDFFPIFKSKSETTAFNSNNNDE